MFYDILQSLCVENGIKVTNLVSKLKISSGNLSKWKAGGIPKGDTLSKLADFFNVSTDYLLGRTDEKKASPSEDELAALLQEPHMKEIYDTALQLTPEHRRLVLAQIAAVKELEDGAKK